ncbi:phosphopantetheine-binding protein [Methylotuvimicrobium alcaliphilum]|jgi:acyl carrier protein|nr:phosphopantetheine-binding protein [Methylotuvimicrobium alcaliphilum]
MNIPDKVISSIYQALNLNKEQRNLNSDSILLGAIPEMDSMAVVTIITSLEQEFDFIAEDDELDAEMFETVGSVINYVLRKIREKE